MGAKRNKDPLPGPGYDPPPIAASELLSDPMYERIETPLKGVVEIYDHTPIDGHLTDGVMMRLSVNTPDDRRKAEVYLDPVSQQELAMALLAHIKDPRE